MFWSYFPLPRSSKIYPYLPIHPTHVFSLLKKNVIKSMTHTKKTPQNKHSQVGERCIRKVWGLLHIGQLLLGLGPTLECGWYTQWHATEENRFPLSQKASFSSSFWVKDGILCSLPPFSVGILADLGVLQVLGVLSPRLWAHMSACLPVLLFPELSIYK